MSLFHSDPDRCDELLKAVVGDSIDRIAIIDTEYRFIGFNAAYQRDFELSTRPATCCPRRRPPR